MAEKPSRIEQISPLEERKNRLSVKFINQSDYSDNEKSQIEKRLGLLGWFADPKLSQKLKEYQKKYPKSLSADGQLWPKTAEFILSQESIVDKAHREEESLKKDVQGKETSYEKNYTFSNGDVYRWSWDDAGAWKDFKMNGKGRYEKSNGDVYAGGFKDGKMNGQGSYTYALDNEKKISTITGNWENNRIVDWSIAFRFVDGSIQTQEIRNGSPVWPVTYVYGNGETFVGTMVDSKRVNGVYTYRDGSKYMWPWDNNKPNGEGTFISATGSTMHWKFKNGVLRG